MANHFRGLFLHYCIQTSETVPLFVIIVRTNSEVSTRRKQKEEITNICTAVKTVLKRCLFGKQN